MANDSGQSGRIAQRQENVNHGVQFITNDSYPEAPWDGMIVYNTEVAEFQIYNRVEEGWLDPFTGSTGNQTYVGPTEPVGAIEGDLWIDTAHGNRLNRYDGTMWVAYAYPRGNVTSVQNITPASTGSIVGDTWIDPDNDFKAFVYDGTTWAPVTTDGIAPTSSPAAIVTGGINSLFVKWTPIDNQSAVTYDVYVTDSLGLTFACTSGLLRTSTYGSVAAFVNELAPGVPLDPALTYYARIIARDDDGSAAPGVGGSASPMKIVGSDIVPGAITATEISDFSIPITKMHSLTHLIY